MSYPEPDNLTAAAAFERIPRDMIPTEALIYKDVATGLWVISVAYELIPPSAIQAWCDLMFSAGAVALWYNPRAVPPRRQLDWNEEQIDVRNHDKISHVDRLIEQGYKILSMPEKDSVTVSKSGQIDIGYMLRAPKKPSTKPPAKKYTRSMTYRDAGYECDGKHNNCKPVKTPAGVFSSVSAAAMAMNHSPSYVSIRIARGMPGWSKLTQEEYKTLSEHK